MTFYTQWTRFTVVETPKMAKIRNFQNFDTIFNKKYKKSNISETDKVMKL